MPFRVAPLKPYMTSIRATTAATAPAVTRLRPRPRQTFFQARVHISARTPA